MNRVVVLTDCVDVAWQEIRGAIYSNCSKSDLIIEPVVKVDSYSIVNVNFLVRLLAEIYPENTIICVIVNPLKERTERIVGRTKKKNIIFEGTNTGAFDWLIRDFGCAELYELFDPGFVPFGGKYVHAPAVGKLAAGTLPKELGHEFPVAKIRKCEMAEGTVMHIDNFGNLKLFHHFKEAKDGDKFKISFNEHQLEVVYNTRMMARDDGEVIIYKGSSLDYTEIGIVRGNFANQYAINNGDVIQIERIDKK